MIVIVDYGMGNLGSIANMLKKVGVPARISAEQAVIEQADKLILPGVGAFDQGMKHLAERGLVDVLNEQVLGRGKPVLGLCLGMQLFSGRSEEGQARGLGWIEAETVRLRYGPEHGPLKVPHMGWNTITPARSHPLLDGLGSEPRFYFVHSYHVVCADLACVLAEASYGFELTAAVARGNVLGVQFHPEKSHRFGMRLLKNFAELV